MTAVLLGLKDSHSLLEITRGLLVENAKDQHAQVRLARRLRTREFYWRGVATIYGDQGVHSEHRRPGAVGLHGKADRGLQVRPAGRATEYPAGLRELA